MTQGRAVIQFPNRRVVVQIVEGEAVTAIPARKAIIRTTSIPAGTGEEPELIGAGYTHNQMVADTVWTITHNLGYRPAVTVFDTAGDEVWAEIDHLTQNSLTITFSDVVSGVAYMS